MTTKVTLKQINSYCLPNDIADNYESIQLKFREGIEYCKVDYVWRNISSLQVKKKLYENIGTEDEEDYVILSNDRFQKLKIEYYKGLEEGYNMPISFNSEFSSLKDESLIRKLYKTVESDFERIKLFSPIIPVNFNNLFIPESKSDHEVFLCFELHFNDYGVEVGRYLKIWNTILDYYGTPFNIDKESIIQNDKNQESQSERKISKEQLLNEQNNLTSNISIEKVYNHFNKLTKTTNKKNEFYLKEQQLLIFIKATFIDLKPIKQEFNSKGFVKKDVRKIFYDFYFINKNKEKNHTSLKRKYFNIMNDAFKGFNKTDYTDFAK